MGIAFFTDNGEQGDRYGKHDQNEQQLLHTNIKQHVKASSPDLLAKASTSMTPTRGH